MFNPASKSRFGQRPPTDPLNWRSPCRQDEDFATAKALLFSSLLTWTDSAAKQTPNPNPAAPRQRPPPPAPERAPQLGELFRALGIIAETAVTQRQIEELEQRQRDYRHLRHKQEITMEWPPAGTPTWDDWLCVRPYFIAQGPCYSLQFYLILYEECL